MVIYLVHTLHKSSYCTSSIISLLAILMSIVKKAITFFCCMGLVIHGSCAKSFKIHEIEKIH